MSVVTASSYSAIIPHLLPGTAFRAYHVAWEDYEQLLAEVVDSSTIRIFYDQGKLEIMALSSPHEKAKNLINRLVTTISDELDIDIESIGSTTIHKKPEAGGAEPDDSFYIGQVSHIVGRRALDFRTDPPPDLVVEIDLTSGSMDKLPVYARFEVAEVWRAVKNKIHIYVLRGKDYDEVAASRIFPFLTAQTLTRFLALGLERGTTHAARSFRAWLRTNAGGPRNAALENNGA